MAGDCLKRGEEHGRAATVIYTNPKNANHQALPYYWVIERQGFLFRCNPHP